MSIYQLIWEDFLRFLQSYLPYIVATLAIIITIAVLIVRFRKEFTTYRTLDITGIGGIAVIAGAIFLVASNYYWTPTSKIPVVGIFIATAIYGIWFIGATAAGYIIRKPLAAFLGEMLGALVEMLLGSVFTVYVLVWGAVQGVAAEIVFALFRYKRWDYLSLSLASTVAGFTVILPTIVFFPGLFGLAYNGAVSLGLPGIFGILLFIIIHPISGIIIAGILTKAVIDQLALTGIFDLFPIGKEIKEKRLKPS